MFCKILIDSKKIRILLCFVWMIAFPPLVCGKKSIEGLRIWTSPESTRIILDLSDKVKYKLFTLEKPERVVIDIEEKDCAIRFTPPEISNSGILRIRYSHSEKGGLRIVFDLPTKVKATSFQLNPNETYGNRLVVDLSTTKIKIKNNSMVSDVKEIKHDKDLKGFSVRDFIVAIDAGHGGDDSGAVGKHFSLREKDVVLSVSKKLENLINTQPGMHAFLVRSGDYYVGLRKRMALARKQGADLFISLHADSFKDIRATGASVFVLSEKGASNEAARWLAEKENRSDLIGGVSLEDKGSLLASVLLDLSQSASQSASHELGNHLISNLGKVTNLHHRTVQHAGFMVLKSPDIPSVLVELGFISNKQGEGKLRSEAHQQLLARALLEGVKAFVDKRPRPISHPQDFNLAKNK